MSTLVKAAAVHISTILVRGELKVSDRTATVIPWSAQQTARLTRRDIQ